MRAFTRIDRLQITATSPLLLWLLVQPTDVLPIDERELAVRAIESFLMRRMAAKEQTRNYGTVFVDVLKVAMQATNHPGRAVIAELRNNPGGAAWTSSEDLVSEFREGVYYGPRGIAQFRLRLLLGAIDARLQESSTKAEPATFDYDKLEIEHIIPQGWETWWPVIEDDPLLKAEAELERASHINRIGNLTLVTSPLNKSLTNDPWAAKRTELTPRPQLSPCRERELERAADQPTERVAGAPCRRAVAWTGLGRLGLVWGCGVLATKAQLPSKIQDVDHSPYHSSTRWTGLMVQPHMPEGIDEFVPTPLGIVTAVGYA